MVDCSESRKCLNFEAQCYRCNDYSLLKLAKDKNKPKPRKSLIHDKDKDKSWKNFEQDSVNKLNNIPTIREARRQSGSGNKWYAPGDIVDDILLLEAKERNQITTTGEKYITIKKEWLEKIIKEAASSNKYPGLVFRFKGDDNSYSIIEFNDFCQIIHEIKMLKEELLLVRGKQ